MKVLLIKMIWVVLHLNIFSETFLQSKVVRLGNNCGKWLKISRHLPHPHVIGLLPDKWSDTTKNTLSRMAWGFLLQLCFIFISLSVHTFACFEFFSLKEIYRKHTHVIFEYTLSFHEVYKWICYHRYCP